MVRGRSPQDRRRQFDNHAGSHWLPQEGNVRTKQLDRAAWLRSPAMENDVALRPPGAAGKLVDGIDRTAFLREGDLAVQIGGAGAGSIDRLRIDTHPVADLIQY